MEMENSDLVSVIIPTYKRYQLLLNAINSVKKQTYKNVEIIVVIDGPTNYPELPFGVKSIKLPENTREKFGYPCPGFCRTIGILHSKGKYVAFLDDDDEFFSNKLTLQIEAMKRTGTRMSCSEALIGNEAYDSSKTYEKFNLEKCYEYISSVFHRKGKMFNGFPELFELDFIQTNNSIITSTVVMERTLLDEIGYIGFLRYGSEIPEDYDCWIKALKFTKCVYVPEPLVYYYSHNRQH
jgi:glycosyltransferase involved in cell wall biosynthesis